LKHLNLLLQVLVGVLCIHTRIVCSRTHFETKRRGDRDLANADLALWTSQVRKKPKYPRL
jgi:hypothetical protein